MSPAKYFKPSILTAEPAFRSSFPKVTSAVNLLSPLILVIQVIDYAKELIKGHLQNKKMSFDNRLLIRVYLRFTRCLYPSSLLPVRCSAKQTIFFLHRHIHQSEAAIQEISSMLTAPIGTYILTPMCILYPGTAPGRVCFFTFVFL